MNVNSPKEINHVKNNVELYCHHFLDTRLPNRTESLQSGNNPKIIYKNGLFNLFNLSESEKISPAKTKLQIDKVLRTPKYELIVAQIVNLNVTFDTSRDPDVVIPKPADTVDKNPLSKFKH